MSTLTITVTNANAKKGTRETTVIVRLTSVKTLTANRIALYEKNLLQMKYFFDNCSPKEDRKKI